MTLKKLVDFCEKNGVQAYDKNTLQNASYKIVKYGADYFYNTKISHDAIMICFDYTTALYTELAKLSKTIEKYATRYGFSIISSWHHLGGFGFSLMESEKWDAIQLLHTFEEYARQDADELIHKYHVEGKYNTHHAQLEAELYNILIEGENAYLERINAENIKGA